MTCQALIKTTPQMLGHYTLDFETTKERAEFIQGSQEVWWYFYPEDDETPLTGAGWRKGGAWDAKPGDETAPAPQDGERW